MSDDLVLRLLEERDALRSRVAALESRAERAEAVGCEQVDAERKRNEELRGLLREQVNIGRMCHICGAHPCYSNCRLRAALEGR